MPWISHQRRQPLGEETYGEVGEIGMAWRFGLGPGEGWQLSRSISEQDEGAWIEEQAQGRGVVTANEHTAQRQTAL